VVVDGDRERPLGLLLPYHILAEYAVDLLGLGDGGHAGVVLRLSRAALDDVDAQLDAVHAYSAVDPDQQLLYLIFALATEGAPFAGAVITNPGQIQPPGDFVLRISY
jgi:hypothetical protein